MNEENAKKVEEVRKQLLAVADMSLQKITPSLTHNVAMGHLQVAVLAFHTATGAAPSRASTKTPGDPEPGPG
ncbi:hypothetical protein WMF45_45840 [Sorangium sp. So ce448]|uniref:hypothetical protein n=1 Tax=Sorangium sp. So ce448 TaxID=3133314 RepID=UPI003F647BD5